MPKSPRGNFNYVEISMYKPFNSSSSTTPTASTAHSQGYRASTHETHEPQFSNPAFSPTVHVPQSILSGSNNSDDSYRSSIDELPSHMTNQAFGYRSQHEQLHQHQRHPSVESAPRSVFDALLHHQNIHQQPQQPPQHQQSPQQHHLQHNLQYQNFNQQQQRDLGHNNNGLVDHSDTMHSFEQQNQNSGQQQLHLAQASSQPPPGPPIQLVNGMHPARLALLQTPEEPETPTPPPVPKKKSKAEKVVNKPQGTSSAAASSSSAPAPPVTATPAPTAAKSNAPKPKLVVPVPAKVGLKTDHLTVQLQTAIASKSAKKLSNIIKKAAGECIVRAFLYIMSRSFSFMSLDLFLNLYREAFGCPKLTEAHMRDSMLEAKLFKTMIETKVENGSPQRKYYRLSPIFFRVLEGRTNSTTEITTSRKEVMYDLANKANLPPITPIPPVMVKYLLDGWDLKLHNVSVQHYAYTPARWPTVAPLNDLQPFLAYWYTPQYEFSQHMTPPKPAAPPKAVAAGTAAKAKTESTPTSTASSSPAATTSTSQGSTSTSAPTVDGNALVFELLLDTAKLQGKPGKEARRLLRMHEQRLIDADINVPPQVSAVLEDDTLSDNSDMELDDDDEDDAPAAIDLTPAPVPMTVCPPANDTTSTPVTFTRMIENSLNGATLPGQGPAIQPSQFPAENHSQMSTQNKGKMPDRTSGPVRISMKQERYQPYVDMHTGEGSPGSESGKQSKLMGEDGTSMKGGSGLPRSGIPFYRNLPTLPRPSLPPLEGQGSSSANPMTLAMLAGGVGSDMTTTEPLLRRSRDDILRQRRTAMNRIIEYTMKMPMRMGPKD